MWWFLRDSELHRKIDALGANLLKMDLELQTMTQAMQALKDKVTEMDSVIGSVLTLITGLVDQLKNANTDAEIQAVITDLEAEKQKLAAAVQANTPGA